MTDFPLPCVIKFPSANLRLKKNSQENSSVEAQITQLKNTSTVVKADCGANLPCLGRSLCHLGHSPSLLLDL